MHNGRNTCSNDIDWLKQMQEAEIAFQREQNELEIARAKELSEIEVSFFMKEMFLHGQSPGKKIP